MALFYHLMDLHIIGKGKVLHHGKQGHKVAVNSSCLSSDKLGDIGVLLLGHNGGACGISVVQLDELELPAAPHNYLLGKS